MPFSIADIFKREASQHQLTLFKQEDIEWLEGQLFEKKGKIYLKSLANEEKDRLATPEEIVRQLYIRLLLNHYRYPKERIFVERGVYFGSTMAEKRADIVVMEKDEPDTAHIIVECKKPKSQEGLEQLKSYCNAEGSPIGVWTNGGEITYLYRQEPNLYKGLPDIPKVDQKLEDLVVERWDIKRLEKENKLAQGKETLMSVILKMENLVLANAGVDAFDEVFKLIYAKLYDEWRAARPGKDNYLEFRLYGSPPREFYERINNLFHKAKQQWPGVFLQDEKIELEPRHLVTCGSFLQDVKLFNANLQVIDEAFEYLSIQVGKGSKGQYFTPRHVIDMCVKMLNPTIDEYMIDTAAGSCGFAVHTIFHVWGNEFTSEGPKKWQSDYASQRVFGLDFDSRSVKIAKALNLIAGDGKTNVYRANTLDPSTWSEDVRVGLRDRLTKFPNDKAENDSNQKRFRFFDFDVLMTNPPFAGDIKDSRILHQFDLAKKGSNRWQEKVGRDILFLERNLEFLKPGGRMCIVLPQGRFNNTSDEYIRRFISEKARILAVVGLHGNTFKPHTGTKTSIIFLQKWNDDSEMGQLCPKVEDYPIFMATSQNGGKDNSGEYIYKKDENGNFLLDKHSHRIVEHDLFEISEGFVKFAKRQGFSFHKD